MSERSMEQIREFLDSLYRVDSGRIRPTLIRLLGDFDLAEEAMHEAFAAALSLWPRSGVPGNPLPWLISTARFKAIDTLRRRARLDASQNELVPPLEAQGSSAESSNEEDSVEDDRLRLIFTCCHPSLPPEAHVALTLREVCGLTITISLALLITFSPPGFAASEPVSGTDISAALAQGKPPSPRNNNNKEANVNQDETIRSQKERQARGPEYDRLEVLIGKWINVGKTEPMGDKPPLDITTSDIYEWLPGKYWILHTAYGRLGNMDVGGVEIIGYDRETGKYVSYFYDSRGNSSEHEIIVDGNTMTWKGKVTGCAAVFSEKGKVQTAHHVRLDDNGRWVPSMEVVLTKVN